MNSKDMQVEAFKGLRYDLAVAGEPASLLAPPYDVIYPDMQDALYRKSQHNVVRLILGKTSPQDTDADNRYTRSAADLERWLKDGVLRRDNLPSLYVYSQTYEVGGEKRTRTGFIGRKKLEDFGGSVMPHENTFAGPKADRLNLTRACKCNFSPIFGLYTDPSRETDELLARITKTLPTFTATLEDGQTHTMWAVTDMEWIGSISSLMEDKTILIADGHHRYETALNYLKENSTGGKTPTRDQKYVLMYFTNTEAEGLTVLPTHRVVNHTDLFTPESFFAKMAGEFEIEKLPSGNGKRNSATEEKLLRMMDGSSSPVFGMYYGGGNYAFLKCRKVASDNPLKKLDVGILHDRILEPVLGVKPQADMDNQQVFYNINVETCASRVDAGISKVAFFLNPTPIAHMREVSQAGLKMPQKSTYFYPKLITGLVFNPLY